MSQTLNMPFNEWRDKVHATAREKGWHEKERTVGDFLMLMVSELAEALEEHRAGLDPNEIYYSGVSDALDTEKPEGIPIELADTIIRILDFCGLHDIDIEAAMHIKYNYNQGRDYRHGGKTL